MKIKRNEIVLKVALILGCIAILCSGIIILAGNSLDSASFAVCKNDCPDGKKVTCKGTQVSSIDDPENPGCKCDGKEFRCKDSDNAESNTNDRKSNENKKDKKKKKNKSSDSDNQNSNSFDS